VTQGLIQTFFAAGIRAAVAALIRGRYIASGTKGVAMRAETERTIEEIRQALALLRRHL